MAKAKKKAAAKPRKKSTTKAAVSPAVKKANSVLAALQKSLAAERKKVDAARKKAATARARAAKSAKAMDKRAAKVASNAVKRASSMVGSLRGRAAAASSRLKDVVEVKVQEEAWWVHANCLSGGRDARIHFRHVGHETRCPEALLHFV